MATTTTPAGQVHETLRRSELMSGVQRTGIVAMVVAMIICVGVIGWASLIALGVGVVGFLAMKIPAIRGRLGVWSLVLAWLLGQAATFTAVVLAGGPTEYVVMMLGIPTILASAVWPPRYVRMGAVATGILVVAAGAVAEGRGLIDRYPAFLIPATVIGAMTWLSIAAREAEGESLSQLLTDPLTGLPNRFALAREREYLEASATPEPAVLMVIDIDHFKRINDTAGHSQGDAALRHTAQVLQDEIGDRGSLVRYGGEEFVAILRGTRITDAGAIAEDLRGRVEQTPYAGGGLTVSIGVAEAADVRGAFAATFDAADRALYRAKAEGRNRIVHAASPVVSGPPVVDRRASRRPASTEGPARAADTQRDAVRAPMLDNVVERAHLVTTMQRLHRKNPMPMVVVYLAAIASIPRIGWAVIPAAAVGSLVFRAVQARIGTAARPIRVMAAAWLIAQLTIIAALPWMHGDVTWLICLATAMVLGSSSAFPLRFIVAGVAVTAVLMLGGALATDPDVLGRAPQVVAVNIAFMVASAITGRAIGTLAVRLRAESNHDAMTGLPNRVALADSGAALLADADERGISIGVIVADIDHFKSVNDRFGHAVGDHALAAVARVLQDAVRADTMVFRTGGEEFAIIVPEAEGDDVVRVAERVRQAIADAPALPGGPLTVSLGVVSRRPGTPTSLGEILQQADLAMYASKRAGRNRTTIAEEAAADVGAPRDGDAVR